uniref:Uncharacterized protein n=1 Tax=Electrophorus electricus TaxID=8005 RepID=A0A4W4G839_ELEEL
FKCGNFVKEYMFLYCCLLQLFGTYWGLMSNKTRRTLEQHLNCCGLFRMVSFTPVFQACKLTGNCFTCGDLMLQHAGETLKFLGEVGLFFSFSEVCLSICTCLLFHLFITVASKPHCNTGFFFSFLF